MNSPRPTQYGGQRPIFGDGSAAVIEENIVPTETVSASRQAATELEGFTNASMPRVSIRALSVAMT
jgi:hypothetical protein